MLPRTDGQGMETYSFQLQSQLKCAWLYSSAHTHFLDICQPENCTVASTKTPDVSGDIYKTTTTTATTTKMKFKFSILYFPLLGS